jgi:hypothetical protein
MKRITATLKQELRGYINPLMLKSLRRTYDLEDVIVISGHFRSGTTWLAELVSMSANAGIIFEPFHIDHVPEAKQAGFTYNNFRRPSDDWPDGYSFVDKVLHGKVLNRWTVGHIPLWRALKMRRLVVKLVSSNQMLVWLTEKFAIPTPVLIIRHPCAVLASWLNRGWRLNNWIVREPALLESFPELRKILDSLAHEEEYFAAKWSIDHYVPLYYKRERSFKTVAFEKLAVDGPNYLQEILRTWDIELTEEVCERLRRPSEKASDHLTSSYESALNGWKRDLSRTQRDRVLRVVREFGLDFYTDALEPDYDRLFSDRPIRLG